MQGLEAISANNGWAMALTGACIVMTGLTTLALIISQLHRIVGLLEKKDADDKPVAETAPEPETVGSLASEEDLLADLDDTAKIYQPLTGELGTSFELSQLYSLMESKKLPHPHITVRELRSAGYLVPSAEGTFAWKNS